MNILNSLERKGLRFIKIWKNYYLLHKYKEPKRIYKFRNIHQNEIVFCIGAGPSLNKENLKLLDGKVAIFTNSAYKVFKKFEFKKQILVCSGPKAPYGIAICRSAAF